MFPKQRLVVQGKENMGLHMCLPMRSLDSRLVPLFMVTTYVSNSDKK